MTLLLLIIMAEDVEPDFASALGLALVPLAAGADDQVALVPVGAGADDQVALVPVAVGADDQALVPVAVGADDQALVLVGAGADDLALVPAAPKRRHRRTHGNFGNAQATRSVTEKRAFSQAGNTLRWARHREQKLQAAHFF